MTEDDKELVFALRKCWQDDPELKQAADRIEALSAEKVAARKEERAAIVAYLRIKRGAMQHIADDLANVIEAGEHLKCTAYPEA